MKDINILVTGCGGDIGFNIGRILKEEKFCSTLVGTDISTRHLAECVFDFFIKVPLVNDEAYYNSIEKIVEQYDINLIIPTSEAELKFFHEQNITHISQAKIISANYEAVKIGMDKLATAEFIKEKGLPFPWTIDAEEADALKYPCILKSRSGSGSKQVRKINNLEETRQITSTKGCIWQEYLSPDDEEYTCGLYRSKDGEIRAIVFKRWLAGGRTGYGEIVVNKEIDRLLLKIAEEIDLLGSINVQLRLTERGPTIFEINPRFSSTVMFRHKLGYRDVIWAIKDAMGLELEDYVAPLEGTRIFRGDQEYIL